MNKRDRIVEALEDLLRVLDVDYDPMYDKGYVENVADEILSEETK